MIELYLHEQALRLERHTLDQESARRANWLERRSAVKAHRPLGVRRRLALTLLALADRLDPRPPMSATHTPRRPTLNGRLHHA